MCDILGSKSKELGIESDGTTSSVATVQEPSSPNSMSHPQIPLAHSMLNAICDLLFCPEFTVAPNKNAARDEVDDLSSLDSCEYIWASGIAHRLYKCAGIISGNIITLHYTLNYSAF